MAKYYVSSGDLQVALIADTSRHAAVNALCNESVQMLGKLTMVSEHGFDSKAEDDWYYCTIDLLEEAGLMDDYTSSEWV